MMKLFLMILGVFVSPPLTFAANLTVELILPFLNDTEYKDNDCDLAETKKHQLGLYFHYRGLYDFRRHYHPDAANDFANRSGSILFVNWGHDVFSLTCPCGKGNDVEKWEEYGAGVEGVYFNKEWSAEEGPHKAELTVKAPRGYYYYRTYGCFANDGKHHYFNVFHRPYPVTDFPVAVGENEKDKDKVKWGCWVAKDKIYTGEKTAKKIRFPDCSQQPYTFGWIFPDQKDNEPPFVRDASDSGHNELDIIDGKQPNYQDGYEAKDVDYKKRDGEVESVLGSSTITLSGDDAKAENAKHAGKYECVVTDRNGLSSAFEYDNLESDVDPESNQGDANAVHGERRNYAVVNVHIRHWYWVFVPLGAAAVVLLLTVICSFACPDNKEEYEEQILEEANQRRADKLREQKEAAAATTAAGKGKGANKSTKNRSQSKGKANAKESKSRASRTPARPAAGTSPPPVQQGRQASIKGGSPSPPGKAASVKGGSPSSPGKAPSVKGGSPPPGKTASVKGAPTSRPVSPAPAEVSSKISKKSVSGSVKQPSISEPPPPHKKHHKKKKHVEGAAPGSPPGSAPGIQKDN